MAYGLQDGGFVLKRLVDIRDDLKSRVEARLGGPIDDSGNSVLGLLLGITAQGLAVLWSELSRVSDNMDPSTASGENLIDWGRRFGMAPKPAQPFATNRVHLKVDSGSETLTSGTSIQIDDVTLVLDGDVTVSNTSFQNIGVWVADADGFITVDAGSGTINNVDWQFDGGDGGRNAESEDEFRTRVQSLETETGCATDQAMTQALRSMPFLVDGIVVSNRSMQWVDGMPPKSYEAIIAPVSTLTAIQDRTVLDTLLSMQPAGIESSQGANHITHTYDYPIPVEVNATLASDVSVDVDVQIEGVYNTQQIEDAITEAFGIKLIGQRVTASSLYCAINGTSGIEDFVIQVNGGSVVNIGMRERAVLGTITVGDL